MEYIVGGECKQFEHPELLDTNLLKIPFWDDVLDELMYVLDPETQLLFNWLVEYGPELGVCDDSNHTNPKNSFYGYCGISITDIRSGSVSQAGKVFIR